MTIHDSLAELIGNTPLVKLNHVTDGIKATIAVKVEYFNPEIGRASCRERV